MFKSMNFFGIKKLCVNVSACDKISALLVFFLLSTVMLLGCEKRGTIAQPVFPEPVIINSDYQGGVFDPLTQLYLIWGTDGVINRSKDGLIWEQSNTTASNTINQVRSYRNDSGRVELLAAGDNNTLLLSNDGGEHWHTIDAALPQSHYLDLLVRTSGDRLLVGTNGLLAVKKLHTEQWETYSLPNQTDLLSLYESPERQVYIGGENGFFAISADAVNWRFVDTNITSPIRGFFQHQQLIIAYADHGTFLQSQDGGSTWSTFNTSINAAFSSAAYSVNQNVIVMAAHNGEYIRSVDNGANWSVGKIQLDGQNTGISSLHFNSQTNQFLASGHNGMFAVSENAGIDWQVQRLPNTTSNQQLLFNLKSQILIAFGRGGQLSVSQNAGLAWQSISPYLGGYYRISHAFKDHWLTLGTVGEIGVASFNGSWSSLAVSYPNPNTPPQYRSLLELSDHELLAAGPTGAILKSTNQGMEWRAVFWSPFEHNEAFTQLIKNPFNNTILAVEAQGRFYRSPSNGESWQPMGLATEQRLWQGSVNPANGATVVVGERGAIVTLAADSSSWLLPQAVVNTDLYGSLFDPVTQQFFVVGDNGVLLKGDAQAEHWRAIKLPTEAPLRRVVRSSPEVLLVFGGKQNIFRSEDGGQSWTLVNHGENGELRDAVVHSKSNTIFITGSHGLLLRSSDDGISWRAIALNTSASFRSLSFSDAQGEMLLTGERLLLLKNALQ